MTDGDLTAWTQGPGDSTGAVNGRSRDGIEGCPQATPGIIIVGEEVVSLKPSRGLMGILFGLLGLMAVTVWVIGLWPPAASGKPNPQPLRVGSRAPAFRTLSSQGPVRFPLGAHASVIFFYEADT